MLGLPFLPTFTDAQFKLKTRFNANNELTILGLGGIDNMKLNTKLDGEKAEYILSYLPKIQQETFTLGAVYRHYAGIHVQSVVVSHSYLNNRNTKYLNNDESSADNLSLKLRSVEQETKFRIENTSTLGNWKINFGANLDYSNTPTPPFNECILMKAGRLIITHIWVCGVGAYSEPSTMQLPMNDSLPHSAYEPMPTTFLPA